MAAASSTAWKEEIRWAIRSYGRAKVSFADMGDHEKSAAEYVNEQNARLSSSCRSRYWLTAAGLFFWRVTCWYGERLRRWAACTFILVASFTVIYQVEYQLGGHLKVTDVCWVDWLTPLYFAAVTTATLGYGDIHAESWLAQLSVIANIFGGYVLLGLGASILARRIKGR